MESSLTYLVIGASRGLGLEFVKQLSAKEGVKVLATVRDLEKATELQQLAGDNVQLFEVDFTDLNSLKALASKLPPYNRLIINAGMSTGWGGLLNTLEDDESASSDLLKTLDVNVVGPFKTIRTLVPGLVKADAPAKVMLMGSGMGSLTWTPGYYQAMAADYSASKSALHMLGVKLSVELKGTKVSVMVMHPGWVKTDLGTDDAPVEKVDSIRDMIDVFEKAENGSFYDYENNVVPW